MTFFYTAARLGVGYIVILMKKKKKMKKRKNIYPCERKRVRTREKTILIEKKEENCMNLDNQTTLNNHQK